MRGMGEILHGRNRILPLRRGRDPQVLQVIGDELHARNDPVVIDGSLQARTAKKDLGGNDLRGKAGTAQALFKHVGSWASDYLPDEGRVFGINVIEVFL